MSHFSVLVIGPDVAAQLAPFHEFECTGTDDQYVQSIDSIEEARVEYAEDYKDDPEYPTFLSFLEGYHGRETVAFGHEPDLEGDHKYGYITLDAQGEPIAFIKRTNPNAKWDWYVLGGRWDGFLTLKNGRSANTATKGEIDFDRMRRDADAAARKTYQATGYAPTMTWRAWKDVVEDASLGDIQARRDFYQNQPDLKTVQAHFSQTDRHAAVFFDFDALLGRDAAAYAAATSNRGITPYALVKDQQWAAKGEMGWFGISSGDAIQADWNEQVWSVLQALPDDTAISAIDCHI